MKKPLWSFFFFTIFSLVLIAQMAFAQNQIPFSVLSSGGEKSSGAGYLLSGTVGESFIGKTVNAANQHNVGFWYVYKQSTITEVEREEETIPTVFKLEQNYPNPFNPSTVIRYQIPVVSKVNFKIYDILGNEITVLVNEEKEPGYYEVKFNALNYASGIYIYRIQTESFVNTKKMLLIK